MASKFIADLSDPQLKQKIEGWKNGERYRLAGMDLLQDSNDGSLATFTVEGLEIEDGEETGATEAEAPAKPAKAAPGKPAVTIQK